MCLGLVSSPALQRAAGVKERREEKKEKGGRLGRGEWPGSLALWFSSPTLTQKLLYFLSAFCG